MNYGRRFQMNLFRQLTILTLMPLVAWSGMPDVGCRCSNGEIRRNCPKLAQSTLVASSNTRASKSGNCQSCCGGNATTRSCCQSVKRATSQSENLPVSCCAENCRCMPVLLEGDGGARLNTPKASVPVPAEFLPIPVAVVRLPRMTEVDRVAIDTGPHESEDLIVLFERFLI